MEVLGSVPQRFTTSIRGRIGYMPQLSVLYPDLTLWENLNFAASLYGMPWKRRRRLEATLDFVELSDAKDRRLRDASGGMQRRLALSAALVHDPELVFLDEPTAGIDPLLRRKLWDHFLHVRDEGRTLFVTTQYVGEAAYCDLVGVLDEGRLLALDTPEGLRRRAYGGEVVDVRFASPPARQDLAALSERVGAIGAEPIDPWTVRIVVEEAGRAIPAVTSWADQRGFDVESAEEHLPPFDDVFVELVHRLRNEETGGG